MKHPCPTCRGSGWSNIGTAYQDTCPTCVGSGIDPAHIKPVRSLSPYDGPRSRLIPADGGPTIMEIARPVEWMRRNAPNISWAVLRRVDPATNVFGATAKFEIETDRRVILIAYWDNFRLAQRVLENLRVSEKLKRCFPNLDDSERYARNPQSVTGGQPHATTD